MYRRLLVLLLGTACTAGFGLLACDDDDSGATCDAGTSPGTDGGPLDSGSSQVDSGGNPTDSGGGNTDAGDAGPGLSSAIGSTARIRVFADAVIAEFKADDTIVRDPAVPECVVHLWDTKPFAAGGDITVGGPVVGADGGPDAPIVVSPDNNVTGDHSADGWAYFSPVPAAFPPDDSALVQVQAAGTTFMPALPAQSLRPSPAGQVVVTSPVVPDGGLFAVNSATDLAITWTPPANAKADAQIIFGFWEIGAANPLKKASIYCGFPIAQGSAKVPQSLLAALKAHVGTGDAQGTFHIFAGGQKEFTGGGVSYVIEVTRIDSTNVGELPAQLQ